MKRKASEDLQSQPTNKFILDKLEIFKKAIAQTSETMIIESYIKDIYVDYLLSDYSGNLNILNQLIHGIFEIKDTIIHYPEAKKPYDSLQQDAEAFNQQLEDSFDKIFIIGELENLY